METRRHTPTFKLPHPQPQLEVKVSTSFWSFVSLPFPLEPPGTTTSCWLRHRVWTRSCRFEKQRSPKFLPEPPETSMDPGWKRPKLCCQVDNDKIISWKRTIKYFNGDTMWYNFKVNVWMQLPYKSVSMFSSQSSKLPICSSWSWVMLLDFESSLSQRVMNQSPSSEG